MTEWFTEVTILALCGMVLAVFLELKSQRRRDENLRRWADEFASRAGGAGPGRAV